MKRILAILIMVMFFLCGCERTEAPVNGATQISANLLPTKAATDTAILPIATQTPTETPSPTVTPTQGPPPDLELKDAAIYPTTFMEAGQDYYLMGRVKNNTQKIMTFSDDDLIFSFIFDVWEYNSNIYARDYEHVRYKDDMELGTGYSRKMNCILYPGDEGVFYYMTRSGKSIKDYLIYETTKDYSGPLGIWYTYQSYYHTDPELPLHYHPATENLEFSKENGAITFDYDVVNIPNLLDPGHTAQVYSWSILLDKDGKIINILKKRLKEMPGLKFGGSFHVHSSTTTSPGASEYFHPFMKITPEMVEQTDHLEVFNEFEEGNTCRKYRPE
jgi:hypothetical protein